MSPDGNNANSGGADDEVRALENWLADHPEIHGDLAEMQRLRELCQTTWPPEPDEATWNAALLRIHASVGRASARPGRWRRALGVIVALGAAAAVLAIVLLTRSPRPTNEVAVPKQTVEEPFPVAEDADVSIVSMDARDLDAIVVGEPPVAGDVEFARAEDIRVIRCDRCPKSGRMARLEQDGEVPMFVSAVAVLPDDE